MSMTNYQITLKDRQTGKIKTVIITAKNGNEAKAIAMREYGRAYEVKGWACENLSVNNVKKGLLW